MFENKKYRAAGPSGGPGVLGPWKPAGGTDKARVRNSRSQAKSSIWARIAGRARATVHFHSIT